MATPVRPPRALVLRYPFGHAMGEAFNRKQQYQIFRDCLDLLNQADSPGTIVESPYRWKREQF